MINDKLALFSEKKAMKENIIQTKSFQFSIEIIKLYKKLREQNEFVIAKQILR